MIFDAFLKSVEQKPLSLSNISVLSESQRLILGYVYEDVILYNKISNQWAILCHETGDPTSGIIDPGEHWVLVAGSRLVFIDKTRGCIDLLEENKHFDLVAPISVFAMRLVGQNHVKVLLDPWGDQRGVLLVDVTTLHITRISSGPDLREEPWRENVDF